MKGGIKSFGGIEQVALVNMVTKLWAVKSVKFVVLAAQNILLNGAS